MEAVQGGEWDTIKSSKFIGVWLRRKLVIEEPKVMQESQPILPQILQAPPQQYLPTVPYPITQNHYFPVPIQQVPQFPPQMPPPMYGYGFIGNYPQPQNYIQNPINVPIRLPSSSGPLIEEVKSSQENNYDVDDINK